MYVCVSVYMHILTSCGVSQVGGYMHECVCLCVYICIHIYIYIFACMYVWMDVCMYVCIYGVS